MKDNELETLIVNNLNAYKAGEQSLEESVDLIRAAFDEFGTNE